MIIVFNIRNNFKYKTKDWPQYCVIVGDFNMPSSPVDRSYMKTKTGKLQLNIINQVVYKILHLNTTEYTISLVAHGTFSNIEHIFRYKASTNKSRKIGNNFLHPI